MSNKEKLSTSPENTFESARELGDKLNEKLNDSRERVGEQSHEAKEKNEKRARAEAMERALGMEKASGSGEKAAKQPPAVRRGSIKRERDASYKRTMEHVQSELSGPSRVFSKVIHNKAVEDASEVVGATVARPNAILAGAIAAFVCTLGVYLISRRFGYQLSGFETIATFAIGWVIGLLFDFLRTMITGKR